MLGRATAEHEQLHRRVERGGVGDVAAQERADLLDVVAEQRRGELQLARSHPVSVAAQRVDLAVVGEHPVRVRQLPAREGVRREARVHEREAADHALVAAGRGRSTAAAAPSACPCRRACATRSWGSRGRRARQLGHAADHVQLALERVLVGDVIAGADEQLGDVRHAGARRAPAGVLVDRHLAPAEQRAGPRLATVRSSSSIARVAGGRVLGQEAHRHAVAARAAAARSSTSPRSSSSGSWTRMPAPSPVKGSAPSAPRCSRWSSARSARTTTSCEAGAPQARDERDAAGIVLVCGVVEASGPRRGGH